MRIAIRAGAALLATTLAALLLSSCGGQDQDGASTVEGPGRGSKPLAAEPGEPAERTPEQKKRDGDERPRLKPSHRAVVYTATVAVRTDDVRGNAGRAQRVVGRAGGYVHDQNISTEARDGATSAVLTFKVPVKRYRQVLDQLGSLGTLLRQEQHAEDVTQQVADVDARVRSAEAALEKLRSLLERAENVDQLLEVQREISEQQAELESLQARQRALEHRTSYATVTLRLHEPAPQSDPAGGGFWDGLVAGWHALVATGAWLLTVLGALVPFLPLIAAAAYLGWWLRRRRRRRAEARRAS